MRRASPAAKPPNASSAASRRQAQADGLAPAAGHVQDVVRRGLGADLGRVDRIALSRDDVGVERVLDVGRGIGLAPETLALLSFSVKSNSGAPSQYSRYSPSSWCET